MFYLYISRAIGPLIGEEERLIALRGLVTVVPSACHHVMIAKKQEDGNKEEKWEISLFSPGLGILFSAA